MATTTVIVTDAMLDRASGWRLERRVARLAQALDRHSRLMECKTLRRPPAVWNRLPRMYSWIGGCRPKGSTYRQTRTGAGRKFGRIREPRRPVT